MADNDDDNGSDDYDSWTWQQIETAILGGVDMSVDQQAVARDGVSSPESFDTAGQHYEKAQNLLQTVHENIKTWADRIIGVEGHWQGAGARSFKKMTDTMLATVEALRVSLAGPPSYKDTLHDAGVALQTAIQEIEEADREGAQATMDKYNEDPGSSGSPPWRTEGNTTIVAVSTDPEAEAEMTAKMRASIKKLAAAYRTTIGNLRDPGEPTFPLPGEDGPDAGPVPVAPTKPGSPKKPPPKPHSNIPGKHHLQGGENGADTHDGGFGTDPPGDPGHVPTNADFPPGTFHITSAPPAGTLPGPAPNLFTAPGGGVLDGPIGGGNLVLNQPTFGTHAPDLSGYDPLTHVAGAGNMAFSGFAPGLISPDGAHFLSFGGPAGPGPALPVAGAVGPYGGPLMPVTSGMYGYGAYPPFVRSGYLREAPGPVGTRVPESAFTAGALPHENFISAPPGPAVGQDGVAGAPIMPGMIGHRGPDEEGHDAGSWLVEQDDSWADGTQSGPSFLTRSER